MIVKKVKVGKFSVAMLPTQMPAMIMYRQANFADYMKTPVLMPKWDKKLTVGPAWQHFVMDKDTKVLRDLEFITSNSDVIIFQRFLNPAGIAIMKAIRSCSGGFKKIGMEIDDYMFNVPTYNHSHKNYLPGMPLWRLGTEQMYLSDFMVVSTNELARRYKKDNPNIFVVENCMDFKWWGKLENKNQSNKKIRIGWCGANAHLEDVNILKNVMGTLLQKYGDKIEFFFYSPNGMFESKNGIINELGFVDMVKYPKKLKSFGFDIGLAPLCDNLFNRCKSANRFLEYSMLSIPTVATDIGGQFSEIIKNGENGFLAKTESDWIEHLSYLIENKEKRIEIGKNAFEFVNSNYRAEHGGKVYDDIVKKAFKVRGNYGFSSNGSVGSEVTKTEPGN